MAIKAIESIEWTDRLAPKMARLTNWFAEAGSALIGFSGGIDSTFLSAVAARVLGEKALAATVDTPFLARQELEETRELASLIGIKHIIIRSTPLEHNYIASNPAERCYHCKHLDFSNLIAEARKAGMARVCSGNNADDIKDYRPGNKALEELQVSSPLMELGFGKSDIREAAAAMGLPNHAKPAAACLASRIPYGTPITPARLSTIEQAENELHKLGLTQCRLRLHDDLGRIEVPQDQIQLVVDNRDALVDALRKAGLRYVTVDLQGYRMGSLNERLD